MEQKHHNCQENADFIVQETAGPTLLRETESEMQTPYPEKIPCTGQTGTFALTFS